MYTRIYKVGSGSGLLHFTSVSHTPNISAYETPAIKIIVGAQRKVFWAHQHFLSKSPFFKRACEGSFSESTSREIRREDDDPLLFHHVLDYLYTSAWSPKILRDGDDAIGLEGRSEDKDVRTVECSRQAQLYCMADFYGLDNMMSQAIVKLKLLAPIPLENLLTIARRTYRRIPSSDTAFREFVRTEAYKLKIDRFKSTAWLSNHVQEGGLLTLDLFMALQRTSERHVKSLGNPARVPGCSEEDVYPTPEFYDDSVDREHIPVSDGKWGFSLPPKKKKDKIEAFEPQWG